MKLAYNQRLFVKQAKNLLKSNKSVFLDFSKNVEKTIQVWNDTNNNKFKADDFEFMYMFRFSPKNSKVVLSKAKFDTIHSYVHGLFNHDFEGETRIELQLLKLTKCELLVPKGYNLTFQYNDKVETMYYKPTYAHHKCIYNLQKNIPKYLKQLDCLSEVSNIFHKTYVHITPSMLDRYTYDNLRSVISMLNTEKVEILIPKYNLKNKVEHDNFIKWLVNNKCTIEIIGSNSYEYYLR